MAQRRRDNSLGVGTYFAAEAHVGFSRRVLILIIDLGVLICAGGVLWIAMVAVLRDPDSSFFLTYIALVWLYLAVLKQSRIRTIGLRLTGARVVNLRGQRPSILRMTFRLLLWAFGPFNLIYDLIWMGADNDLRTLRDCFAGTCVINNEAQPAGTAEIHLVYYHAFGLILMYPRVTRPKTS